jgi:hypothetical protein
LKGSLARRRKGVLHIDRWIRVSSVIRETLGKAVGPMGNRSRLRVFLVTVLGSLAAFACPAAGLTLADFETYAGDGDLNAAWVPSANGVETLEFVKVFEGSKSMRVDYNCGVGDFSSQFVYGTVQNWVSYTTLSLMYVGMPGNSAESVVVELRDQWGNFFKGPAVLNATKASAWTEYSIDISGWPNREWVKQIRIWVEAEGWGTGAVFFDYMLLPSAISVDTDTWSAIKALYGGRKQFL